MSPQPIPFDRVDRPLDPRESGRGLLRIAPLVAIAILLVNDHVLKGLDPGLLTGKLSDIAGLVFFPLVLVATVELLAWAANRPITHPSRLLTLAVVVTGVAFALIKVVPSATELWAVLLGGAQWPFAAVAATANQAPLPTWRAVSAVTDPTDLVALPALLLAWIDGRGRLQAQQRRPNPVSIRIRPGVLPLVALIVAGLASLATGAATGLPTNVELPVQTDLTEEHPVAIRTFELTIDASSIQGAMTTVVGAAGGQAGVRYVLTSGDQQGRSDLPNVSDASLRWGRCPAEPCSRTITLISELLEPSTAPVSATTTLKVTVMPMEPKMQLAANHIVLAERDQTRLLTAPAVVTGELSGQDTLGPANPLVEHRISIHGDPGVVGDPSRLVLGGRLHLDAPGGPGTIELDMGIPTPDDTWSHQPLPAEMEFPEFKDCSKVAACDFDYVIRLKASPTMAGPAVIRWRIALEMIDYDAAAPPKGRAITLKLAGTTAADPSPTTLRQTIRGRYEVTQDGHAADLPYVIALDPSIMTLPDGTPRQVLLSQAMTMSGVEAAGPRTHERPALFLRVCRAICAGGAFDGDGRAHTFRRYDVVQCDADCGLRYYFNVFVDGPGVATPVRLEWTLEIEVTSWGGPALPADSRLDVRVLPLEK